MNDIALVWDNANGRADFAMANGDLVMDPGLLTSVIISLFCDRLADPSDVIPDGGDDRRGWWPDDPLDLNGSKLWLYRRVLQVDDTLRKVEAAARAALAWMIADGVAESVTPTATFPSLGRINLVIAIRQSTASHAFDGAWSKASILPTASAVSAYDPGLFSADFSWDFA